MQTTNPFEIILSRLDVMQSSLDNLSDKAGKEATKTTADPERLIDLVEAAQVVCKPVGTIRHYIHHRNLPATKIGKSYLIKLPELLRWVDNFQKKAPKETVTQRMMANRQRYRKS